MYCYRCGNTLAKGSSFCSKCGASAENATKRPKEKNPVSKFLHWYVDGFMKDPLMWTIGTCLILSMIVGMFGIGPCSEWMGKFV